MKPNLFSIATKELSQDGFFTWLLQWADAGNAQYDEHLNAGAKELIRLLINRQHPKDLPDIISVETWRQWNHIDIIAEVNEDFVIVIEDKTNSGEHSEQLERYKDIVTEHYQGKNKKLVFIYLKTGNESAITLKKVTEKGFSVVDRKAVLSIFNRHRITNQIFMEFKEYLSEMEEQTNSYGMLEQITSVWKAAEGFYMALQEKLEDGHWGVVNSVGGKFLGFWYYWRWFGDGNLYIQIENTVDGLIKLVIKIDEWEPETETLYEILEGLQAVAPKHGLSLKKPGRYKPATTSTVAIVENAFIADSEGRFDLDKFITTLRLLERVVEEYCALEDSKRSSRQLATEES